MEAEIDLLDVNSKEVFHDLIQEQLSCPDYYGRNLDALYDVLTESAEPLKLIFRNFEDFEDEMPGYSAALREMCEEAMAECPQLQVEFL